MAFFGAFTHIIITAYKPLTPASDAFDPFRRACEATLIADATPHSTVLSAFEQAIEKNFIIVNTIADKNADRVFSACTANVTSSCLNSVALATAAQTLSACLQNISVILKLDSASIACRASDKSTDIIAQWEAARNYDEQVTKAFNQFEKNRFLDLFPKIFESLVLGRPLIMPKVCDRDSRHTLV